MVGTVVLAAAVVVEDRNFCFTNTNLDCILCCQQLFFNMDFFKTKLCLTEHFLVVEILFVGNFFGSEICRWSENNLVS